jgi:hypothetical protein
MAAADLPPAKIKLTAIAKDEAAYIPAWIHHHQFFGIDGFDFWINGTTDNSLAILDKLAAVHPSISYRESDDLLHQCQQTSERFQLAVYKKALAEETQSLEYTHLLFLDLDEYITPYDFTSSLKDLCAHLSHADVLSFLWHIDRPGPLVTPFSPPFSTTNQFQRDRHLKSMCRLSSAVKAPSVHSFDLLSGNHFLSNGEVLTSDMTEFQFQLLTTAAHQRLINENHPLPFYTAHVMNRSPVEYLSSLFRGRNHTGTPVLMKDNRYGYSQHIPPDSFSIEISKELLDLYAASYQRFVSEADLGPELVEAQRFVIKRAAALLKRIAQDPPVLIRFARQLRGLDLEALRAWTCDYLES